jgi:hypothetical protein
LERVGFLVIAEELGSQTTKLIILRREKKKKNGSRGRKGEKRDYIK